MQTQADLLGVPVLRPRLLETTALGAANMAGIGAGVWPGLDVLAARWQLDRAFEPAWSADRREAMIARWTRAVERARGWADAAPD
jgi:glycerol kinase